jgi:uncharacterized membrane protein YphA (DoxX/SURF4 family)
MKVQKLQILIWVLVAWSAFVLVQSLFFKFQGHEETRIIFNTIGEWMAGIGFLAWAADPFSTIGGYTVGTVELVATILLLIPKTRFYGALLAIAVLSGAIFFHLFTPLGVDRVINANGDTDGGALFFMACSVWAACLAIAVLQCKCFGDSSTTRHE